MRKLNRIAALGLMAAFAVSAAPHAASANFGLGANADADSSAFIGFGDRAKADARLEARAEARAEARDADWSDRADDRRSHVPHGWAWGFWKNHGGRDGVDDNDDENRTELNVRHAAAVTATGEWIIDATDRLDALAEDLDDEIDEARADGDDVTAAVDAHADFIADVNDAEGSADAAVDAAAEVSASTDDDEADKLLDEAQGHLKDAFDALREAGASLKTMLDELDLRLTAGLGLEAS